MKVKLLLICLLSSPLYIQAESVNNSEQEKIQNLESKIAELNEIVDENSRMIKAQLLDLHREQNSKGYLELKFGLAKIDPTEVEDDNDEFFSNAQDSSWDKFDYAKILELEIGKSVYQSEKLRHEIGIGFQQLESKKLSASYTSGGKDYDVFEKITFQTLYLRYVTMFKLSSNFSIGPGSTLGYSPTAKIVYQVEEGDKGVQFSGEGTSTLFEIFGKGKLELSRYFSLVFVSGYRIQEAKNVRLNVADVLNVKTKLDIDMSGLFTTVGVAANF